MSEDTNYDDIKPTQALPEHAWLKRLVGTWDVTWKDSGGVADGFHSTGVEVVTMLGDLWAVTEGTSTSKDGETMHYRACLGFDVTFKEYRGSWIASASSHLWKYEGVMSEDKNILTLNCLGPDMMKDNAMMNYRDVIEFIDENTRTLSSYAQDENGEWIHFMTSELRRRA